jgi:hypothetical protein
MGMSDNFEELFTQAMSELTSHDVEPTTEPAAETETTEATTTEVESTDAEDNTDAEVAETEQDPAGEPASGNEVEDNSEKPADESGIVAVNEDSIIRLPDGTEVSVKEAALRQADYTRKTQQIAEERKLLEGSKAEFSEALSYVDSLKTAWAKNPAEVVAGFVSSSSDPTLLYSQVLIELSKSGTLDNQFLETFGITPDVQKQWQEQASREADLDDVRRRLDSYEAEKAQRETQTQFEMEQEATIAQYEQQWDGIKSEFGVTETGKDELELKIEVLQYASARGITDLRSAFAALQFEKSRTSAPAAPAKAGVSDKKRATSVVTAKGTSGSGAPAKPVSSLEDAAWEAFREISSRS